MQRCMDVKFHLRNVKFLTDRIRIIIYYNKERETKVISLWTQLGLSEQK